MSTSADSLHHVGFPESHAAVYNKRVESILAGTLRIEQRVSEAEKLGFERIFISKYNSRALEKGRYSIEVVPVSKVQELYSALFR